MKSGSIKAIKSLAMLIYRVTNIWNWEILITKMPDSLVMAVFQPLHCHLHHFSVIYALYLASGFNDTAGRYTKIFGPKISCSRNEPNCYIIIILIFASIFVLALDMSILGHSFIKSYIFLIDTNIFPILYKFCKLIAILIVYVLYE